MRQGFRKLSPDRHIYRRTEATEIIKHSALQVLKRFCRTTRIADFLFTGHYSFKHVHFFHFTREGRPRSEPHCGKSIPESRALVACTTWVSWTSSRTFEHRQKALLNDNMDGKMSWLSGRVWRWCDSSLQADLRLVGLCSVDTTVAWRWSIHSSAEPGELS